MKKQIFSCILATSVMLSIMPMGAMAAETTGAATQASITEPQQVSGVYQISTAGELEWFAQQTQGYEGKEYKAILTDDIDLGGENLYPNYMIGTSTYPYGGTFNGDGHTIKGLSIGAAFDDETDTTDSSLALFAYTQGATIQKLTVEGSVNVKAIDIDSYKAVYVAGIAGYDKASTFSDLVSKVNVSVTGEAGICRAGGITAVAMCLDDASKGTTFENCVNQGNVTSGRTAGGVLGYGSIKTTLQNCKNTGAVTATKVDGSATGGGIAAVLNGSSVTACVNKGKVTSDKRAGGVVGECNLNISTNSATAGEYPCIVRYCYNMGDILIKDEGSAGGVVGTVPAVYSSGSISKNNMIMYCYNAGTVAAEVENRWNYIGGVIGDVSCSNTTGMYLYTLDTAAASWVGSYNLGTFLECNTKTSDEMKSESFAKTMGSQFEAVSGSYPKLTWEPEEEPDPEPPVTTTTYTVTTGEDSNIAVGEQALVTLDINSDTEEAYNAYYFTVTYDAEKLDYVSINTDAKVSPKDGVLTIGGYGDNRTCGTDKLIITFRGKEAGDAVVTVTAANIDKAANAVENDAPAATITKDSATITVGGYKVDLSDDFDGDKTVKANEDYKFTARDTHYDYTIDAKMGENTVDVIDNKDGSYTIKNVTGNLTITSSKTPKTYNVTVEGTGKADVQAADKATYTETYTFTLNNDENYTYEVTVKAGETTVNATLDTDGKTYTIAGSDVTGDIVITVEKTRKPETMTEIVFTGSGSGDVKGGTSQTGNNGEDFTFEIDKKDGYLYTVKLGEDELTAGEDDKYTIPGNKLTGGQLTVTVEKEEEQKLTVEVFKYLDLQEKQTMWLVTASGTVSDEKVLAYDGNAMYWSEKYKAYSYLVISENTETLMKTEAIGKIAEASADKTELKYDFDVNQSGLVDVNDAQLVYGMYNAAYNDFEKVSIRKFLEADVNGSKDVTVEDASAVVNSFITE